MNLSRRHLQVLAQVGYHLYMRPYDLARPLLHVSLKGCGKKGLSLGSSVSSCSVMLSRHVGSPISELTLLSTHLLGQAVLFESADLALVANSLAARNNKQRKSEGSVGADQQKVKLMVVVA